MPPKGPDERRFHQLSGARYSNVGTGAELGMVRALALSWSFSPPTPNSWSNHERKQN
jgi:hypothetical protein